MKRKITDTIVDMIIYYLSILFVSFVFKQLGWIEGNIYLYSLALTIGGTIAKMVISFFKKKNLIKL